MAAGKPFLNLDPSLDLPKAMEEIARQQATQTAGVQQFGADQDRNIQGIYGQLRGDLQRGVGTVQSIYGNAAGNVAAAYDRGGLGAQGAAATAQAQVGDFASRLGMDPAALASVQGKMAQQAQTFDLRNKQSSASRQANLQQLGAGMSAVAQLGVQAASQAEAQGRADLGRKIQTELQRVGTAAAQLRTGFTKIKADQVTQALLQAQKEMMQTAKEMASEQRAAARASRSGGGSGSPYADRDQAMQEARFEAWMNDRNAPAETHPFDLLMQEAQGRYGPQALSYIEARAAGMSAKEAKGTYKTPGGKNLNVSVLEPYVNRLKLAK